jgi:hypothetical protein
VNKISTKARRFVGLDVHADTISVAIAEEGAVRSVGTIPNREESIRRLVKKLNEGGAWAACYEAGPTGYTLYWQLSKLGVDARDPVTESGRSCRIRWSQFRRARSRSAVTSRAAGRF